MTTTFAPFVRRAPLGALILSIFASHAAAQIASESNAVVVRARKPVVPNALPSTVESLDAQTIETSINAIDSEDVLKYLPNLAVRKRFIGDFDHAVMATRTSGTNFPARSLVYADGLLLSNPLGNNNAYTPRWGLITPDEIARVDAIYGPFVAAYPGNSMGAVVNFTTKMPSEFEGHAKLQVFTQRYKDFGVNDTFSGSRANASVGNKWGDLSLLISGERLKSAGQPITFAAKLLSAGTFGAAGTPVTGAIPYRTPTNADGLLLGATNQNTTQQDHAKFKVAYDFSQSVKATYTFGVWENQDRRASSTYLRDAAGNPVYAGVVNTGGRSYAIGATEISPSRQDQQHQLHGFNLTTSTGGTWDARAVLSLYRYGIDLSRSPTVAQPLSQNGGAGTLTNQQGTGWNTLDLDATWRPGGDVNSAHIVTFGYHRDQAQLRNTINATPDWLTGSAGARVSGFTGDARTQALWAQDAWRFAPTWKATLGARLEQWQAFNGTTSNAAITTGFASRQTTTLSPKFALQKDLADQWQVRGAIGRAVRFPTVAELFQTSTVGVLINNDPNLKPEQTISAELSAEKRLGEGKLRITYFHESLRDALFSQTNVTVTPNVTNIQNIDRVRTNGLEVAYQQVDLLVRGLDVNGSVTYTDSTIIANAKFPASVGKAQPRIPKWRASGSATYRYNEMIAGSLGARYTSNQYNTLDNSDPNGFSYTGTSRLFMVDARLVFTPQKNIKVSMGVDNLNNYKAWAFHPYAQRTWLGEVKVDF